MSRSTKHSTVSGHCSASSEADDKKQWHRSHRRRNKVVISGLPEDCEIEFVHVREVSDPWSMAKDGKGGYLTDTEVRREINAELTDILNDRASITRHWYASKMMKYYNLKKPGQLLDLSVRQIEEFIRVHLKKFKRK